MPSSTGQDDHLLNELANALRSAGFGKLAHGHPWQPSWDPLPALLLMLGAAVGVTAALIAVGLPWLPAVLGALVVIAAPAVVAYRDGDDDLIMAVYVAPPVLAAVAVLVSVGWEVLLTNVLPFALGLGGGLLAERFEPISPERTLRAVKSVVQELPLLFPLVALVLFALIITSEIWQVANTESALRLAVLAAVVIVPVTWQMHRTITDRIDERFQATAHDALGHPEALKAVTKALHADKEARALTTEERDRITAAIDAATVGPIDDKTCTELIASLKRRVRIRLVLTVLLVGFTAFGLILGLTWLTVADSVASAWAGPQNASADIPVWEPFGLFAVPLGPYLKVSALLATLAVAVFLAFVLTNEDLLNRFRAGYIERPAATAVLLVVSYAAERQRLEEAARQEQEQLVPA